jgi:molecular chaperone IbpA
MQNYLIDPLYRHFFIGYNDMLKRVDDVASNAINQTYPPFNLKKVSDNDYIIELALAGFEKEDIDIEVDRCVLTVKSNVKAKEESSGTWIHKGIALRNFTRKFNIAETVKVTKAEMVNGMLKVWVENIVPEEEKPVKIEVL